MKNSGKCCHRNTVKRKKDFVRGLKLNEENKC